MPPPIPPYRFALGERDGKESYLIQWQNGLSWINLPEELEVILKDIDSDVLDFSLGSGGRFYVRYKHEGVVKRKLSRGLWAEIDQDHREFIDRLTLGQGHQHWGVMTICEDNDELFDRPFADTTTSFREHYLGQMKRCSDYDLVKFVALGDGGDWAFNIDGRVRYSGPRSFRKAMKEAGEQGKEVRGVAFSRVDRGWLIILDDGSVVHHLTSEVTNAINEYMRPLRSLTGSSVARQAIRRLSPTDPMFAELSCLFHDGWKHPDKPRPQISLIFTVILTESLATPYQEYQNALIRQGIAHGNEELKFHGTRRACSLGDSLLGTFRPCSSRFCNLCGILRISFKVSKVGTAPGRTFLRFGRGIYTTSVSSKADDYNGDPSTDYCKAMLVARVVLGKSATKYRTNEHMNNPPRGFHSVQGEVGADLKYDEQVVYRDEAIRPAYLIIYEDESDSN